jgi:hypothetical protein
MRSGHYTVMILLAAILVAVFLLVFLPAIAITE